MNIARVMVCCTLLLAAGWWQRPAYGQEPGVARVGSPYFGTPNPLGTRFNSVTNFGDGRGWDAGFQTIDIFQPLTLTPEQFVLFGNARGFAQFTGGFGGNLGAGIRYLDWNTGYIWGASGWYDHDSTGYREFSEFATYDQVGLSLEALGPYVDFRANAYIPTTPGPRTLSRTFTGTGFQGFNIMCLFDRQLETAMRGGDFEVGGNVIPALADLGIRPYAGGYYYEGEGEEVTYGVKARVEALVTQNFALEANVTNDRLWGTHVGGAATLRFGSGQPAHWFTRPSQVDRLYWQTERNYRLAIHRQLIQEQEVANDAVTGTPTLVFHIDNTAAPGGDGTAERPLNFIPGSVPGVYNIILVERGDGTTNGYTGGITLFDDQRFLGSGFPHLVNLNCGLIPLASTPGAFPTITSIVGDAVTLADNNEVAAFNIVGAVGAGIRGDGINGFNLHDLNLVGNTRGIYLTNASGSGLISDVTATNNPFGGIVINNTGSPPLSLFMNRVTATGSTSGAGIEMTADGTQITALLTDVTATGNLIGLHAASSNVGDVSLFSSTGNYSNNITDGSADGGSGVLLESNGSTLTFSSFGDQMIGNRGDGVRARTTNFGSLTANFLGGTVASSNVGNGFNGIADSATLNLNVSSLNNFNFNALNGVNATLTNNSVYNLAFDGSSAVNNTLNGILASADASVINASISNSTLSNNGLNGIEFILANNSTLNATLLNNTISNNGGSGVLVVSDTSNVASFLATTNVVTANAGAGYGFDLTDSTLTVARFENDSIVGNSEFGIVFNADSSVVNAEIGPGLGLGNLIQGNASGGIALITTGTPVGGSTLFINHNRIADNVAGTAGGGHGVFLSLGDTASLTLGIDDNIIENNVDGIRVLQLDNNVLTASITNNVIGLPFTGSIIGVTGNRGDGIHLERYLDAETTYSILNNQINGNAGDGIDILDANGRLTPLLYTVNNNSITNNGQHGLRLRGEADVDVVLNMDTNEITDNGLDGLNWTAVLGSSLRGTWNNINVQRNAGDGLDLGGNSGLPGGGPLTITNSTITDNGVRGIDIDGSAVGNVRISDTIVSDNGSDGLRLSAGSNTFLSLTRVFVERNGGDGLTITSGSDGDNTTVAIAGSFIRFNAGRGVEAIQTTPGGIDADLIVAITNTEVVGNGDTGIFIQNESQDFFDDNNLTFVLTDSTVSGNGSTTSAFDGGVVLRQSVSSFGNMFADVERNTFSGNFGADFYTEAFRGLMPDPGDTVADPLARLDLQFRNNTGNEVDVNNYTLDSPTATFYANSSTVKSPIASDTPPGPFLSNTRRRNAVRLPAFYVNGVYPGTGDSTFRVENDVLATNSFGLGMGGFTQSVPLGGTADETPFPYEWLFVPVGTLFP